MKKCGWKLALPLTSIALAAVLAAPPAFAADPAPAAGPAGPIGHLLKCLSIVDLTDVEKAAIKTILETEKPKLQAIHEKLKTDRAALKAAIEAKPVDPCAVGRATLALHADREVLVTELKSIRTQVEAVLTPEQVAKLNGCLQAPQGPAATAAAAAALAPPVEDGDGPTD